MGFIDRLVLGLFTHMFDKVWNLIEVKVIQKMDAYHQIYEKHDQKKNEMAEELAQATTDEERDAILSKIYNSRPDFK